MRPLSGAPLELAAGQLVRLESPRDVEVACERGRVWVTEERQARDVWLEAGQSVRLQARGVAIVEATRAACIRIATVAIA